MAPKALNSEADYSRTPSVCKARKTRTIHKPGKLKESSMHALYPTIANDIGSYTAETKDFLLAKVPQSLFEGAKRLHVKGKPLETTVGELDAFRMHKTCHNADLHGSSGPDLQNYDVLKLRCSNKEHFMHSILGARSDGFGKVYGDNKAEEREREDAILCDQQTHFLGGVAGLIIRALRSQLSFLLRLFFTLLSAWYGSILFALNPMHYMLKAKVRAIEGDSKENNDMVVLGSKITERVFTIQPTNVKGTRKLVVRCSTALYTVTILTLLFVASLVLGHFVVKGFVDEPIQLYETLHFDYTKPVPVALVDFSFLKVYVDPRSMMRRIAYPTKKFCATAFFTLPESDFNKELGIFQVTTELLSATGQVLLSKTQPCMLRFRSTPLQHAKSLLMAIPLLTGFYSETQTLALSLLEWREHRTLSFVAVKVMLSPRAGRPSARGLPELYNAKIHVDSELPWWLSIIGHWRWTLSVWIGLVIFIAAVALLLLLCPQLLIPDLGLVLSLVTDGLVHGKSLMGKAACHKHGMFVSESALEDMDEGVPLSLSKECWP